MEFTNVDYKFNYPEKKFEFNLGTNISTSEKRFSESDLMSKRTPKCARFDCNP